MWFLTLYLKVYVPSIFRDWSSAKGYVGEFFRNLSSAILKNPWNFLDKKRFFGQRSKYHNNSDKQTLHDIPTYTARCGNTMQRECNSSRYILEFVPIRKISNEIKEILGWYLYWQEEREEAPEGAGIPSKKHKTHMKRTQNVNTDSADASTDLADSRDSVDSADWANSADSTYSVYLTDSDFNSHLDNLGYF